MDVGVEETKAVDHLRFTNRGVELHDLLRACRKPVSGLDRKRFSCPEKLFIVEGGKKKILFDVWGEGFRGQENVIGNCSMRVSDVSPRSAGSRRGMWP